MNSLRASLATAALSRGVSLFLSTSCTLISSTIIIRNQGLNAFGAITLLSAMAALVPYADLGVGTAVVNAASDRSEETIESPSLERVLAACLKLTLGMSLILSLVSGTLWAAGLWPILLGEGALGIAHSQLAVTVLFTVVAATIPLGLGQRVLMGLSMVAKANVMQCTAPAIGFAIVLGASSIGCPAWVYVVSPAVGALVANILTARLALRQAKVTLASILQVKVPLSSYRDALAVGFPSLVIVTASAATFQSGRLILSHFSSPQELARYALVSPIWMGITSIVAVTGQILWPLYRRMRGTGQMVFSDVLSHMRLFALIGVVGASIILMAGPIVIWLQTSGTIPSPWPALMAAAVLLLSQSIMLPLAMLLTSPSEWRMQAGIALGMAFLCLISATLLCPILGAAGAYLSGAIGVLCWQLPVTLLVARRRFAMKKATPHSWAVIER